MKRISSLFFVSLFFVACSYSSHLNTYEFSNGWKKNEIVTFDFNVPESKTTYNLFLLLRHNKNYSFSNIFLITQLKLANDSILIDTLEYKLSEPNGKWLGEKRLSLVEYKLLFKKNIDLIKDSINYLSIRNSMRLNNVISPIENLENILDLGLLIEPSK